LIPVLNTFKITTFPHLEHSSTVIEYRGVTRLVGTGARDKIGDPVFEPEVNRKQMYCIEGSTCDIVGTFGRPHCELAPGKLFPLSPLGYDPD